MSLVVTEGSGRVLSARKRSTVVDEQKLEQELYASAVKWARTAPHAYFDGNENEPQIMQAVTFDIPEDIYGAAILAIIRESQRLDSFMGVLRLTYPLVLLLLNLLSQGLILYFIFGQVVKPAVHMVQELMVDFHAHIYTTDGQFKEEVWDTWDRKAEVCQLALSNSVFSYIILFLWTASNTVEFRAAERFHRSIAEMPGTMGDELMIGEVEGSANILRLNRSSRRMLVLFVVLPKGFFCLMLWYCGCEVLAATTSFQELVLNSVAMDFVTNVDEILYHALLPATYAKLVRDIDFTYYVPFDPKRVERSEKQSFKRCIGWFIFTLLLVWVYMNYVQDVLPGPLVTEIHHHCGRSRSWDTICSLEQILTGKFAECFPYGSS